MKSGSSSAASLAQRPRDPISRESYRMEGGNCLSRTLKRTQWVMRTLALIVTAVLAVCEADSAEVNVYAAASLTDAMKEIAANYEKQSGDKILFNFGASSLLARQIMEYAPADMFLSADEAQMDELQKANLIATETRRDLLSNLLVIVVPLDSKLGVASPEELVNISQKVAIADPRAVPAGIYTKQYLTRLGLWQKLEPKIVPTENVRTALAAVESGNVGAGFVYKTDANISSKVKIAFTVPVDQGPVIRYPVALIKDPKNKGAAQAFLQYVESTSARKIFERYGFIVKF